MDGERLLRLLERADLADNPRMQKLVRIATQRRDTAVARYATTLIEHNAAQHHHYPFDFNDAVQSCDGIEVGTIIGSSSPYVLRKDVLSKHLLVLGQSGMGKTTLFYTLLDELSVPAWVFDIKQDYRHLVSTDQEVLVVPWPQLRVNPLRPPPGVTPRQWAQVVTEVFGHANALLSASKNYVLQAVMELYEAADGVSVDVPVSSSSERSHSETGPDPAVWPTLHSLHAHLDENTPNRYSKASSYHDTVANRLDALLSVAGPVLDTPYGYPFTDLLTQTVVFEFDGLRSDFRNFLMELLFAWVFEYRLANAERGDQLRHAFVLDEGKHVFSLYKERQDAAGLPFIDEMTAELREFGEALLVADQEASKLTDSIKANTYTTILLGLGDDTQFREATAAMNLSPRQQAVARQLGVGQAIIQQGTDAPTPVHLHEYPVEKTITETQLNQRFQSTWRRLHPSSSPSSSLSSASPEPDAHSPDTDDSPPEPAELAISDDAEELLRDIAAHPFKTHTQRYDLFSTSSPHRGITARDELMEAGLIREHTTVDESGDRKLLELTEPGRTYLADHDVSVSYEGRGGVVHRYWQRRICDLFQNQGYTAEIETDDADVAVQLDGQRVAIEVAMRDRERETQHVQDRLAEDFDEVIIACRTPEVRRGLQQRIHDAAVPEANVQVRLFRDFFSWETLQS